MHVRISLQGWIKDDASLPNYYHLVFFQVIHYMDKGGRWIQSPESNLNQSESWAEMFYDTAGKQRGGSLFRHFIYLFCQIK